MLERPPPPAQGEWLGEVEPSSAANDSVLLARRGAHARSDAALRGVARSRMFTVARGPNQAPPVRAVAPGGARARAAGEHGMPPPTYSDDLSDIWRGRRAAIARLRRLVSTRTVRARAGARLAVLRARLADCGARAGGAGAREAVRVLVESSTNGTLVAVRPRPPSGGGASSASGLVALDWLAAAGLVISADRMRRLPLVEAAVAAGRDGAAGGGSAGAPAAPSSVNDVPRSFDVSASRARARARAPL